MELQTIPISKLKPAKYNPRKDLKPGDVEYEKIKNSLNEFGYIDPVIWNKQTGNVVGGHQRLKILIEQGAAEVECVVVDFDEVKEKLANIALNKISGDWEFSALADLILDLDTLNADLAITGFDDSEIQDIIGWTPENIKTPEQDDFIPEPPKEAITKTGDIWLLGKHRVMCGDSTKIEDVERLMDGKKADLVFTDPPYGINLDAEGFDDMPTAKGTQHKHYKNVIGDSDDFKPELIESLFTNFNYCKEVFIWGADYFAEYIPKRNDGSFIVWDKRQDGGIDKLFGSSFELCWSKQKHKRDIVRILWAGYFGMKGEDTKIRIHPTQKPVELVIYFINKWGQNTNILADLFLGSGSTLIACEKTNRICYGMEIDPVYCDVIVKRWEDYTGKNAELLCAEKQN